MKRETGNTTAHQPLNTLPDGPITPVNHGREERLQKHLLVRRNSCHDTRIPMSGLAVLWHRLTHLERYQIGMMRLIID